MLAKKLPASKKFYVAPDYLFDEPESLTFENHCGKGCELVFNDGHVEFIRPQELGQLKWADGQNYTKSP
jgi:hypothetical protein